MTASISFKLLSFYLSLSRMVSYFRISLALLSLLWPFRNKCNGAGKMREECDNILLTISVHVYFLHHAFVRVQLVIHDFKCSLWLTGNQSDFGFGADSRIVLQTSVLAFTHVVNVLDHRTTLYFFLVVYVQ